MTPKTRFVILANGDLHDTTYILSQLQPTDIIIAANGGSRVAYELGKVPQMVIGDSDSLPISLQEWLNNHNVPRKRHPIEKDNTDLELAIEYALNQNPDSILFLGFTGSRTDHVLANFSILAAVAAQGIQAEVIVNHEHIYTVTQSLTLTGKKGDTLSILPWGGTAEGVTTTGMKWELQNDTLPFGQARGISNVMLKNQVKIEVKKGLLLVVHQHGNDLG